MLYRARTWCKRFFEEVSPAMLLYNRQLYTYGFENAIAEVLAISDCFIRGRCSHRNQAISCQTPNESLKIMPITMKESGKRRIGSCCQGKRV